MLQSPLAMYARKCSRRTELRQAPLTGISMTPTPCQVPDPENEGETEPQPQGRQPSRRGGDVRQDKTWAGELRPKWTG